MSEKWKVQQILNVSASEVRSPADFYRIIHSQPVIVKEAFSNNLFLSTLAKDSVQAFFAGSLINAYLRESGDAVEVPAEQIFEDLVCGVRKYSVVDHTVIGTPFGERFSVPDFLSNNWYVGAGMGTDGYERSVTITAAGNFTAAHYDANGMQGWMYLVYGTKRWTLFDPVEWKQHLFDATTQEYYNEEKDAPERWPNRTECTRYEGTCSAGDLLLFPPGWLHQVKTTEESFGIGGSILNEYLLRESIASWLFEVANNCEGSLNFPQLIEAQARKRLSEADAQSAVTLLHEMCDAEPKFAEWSRKKSVSVEQGQAPVSKMNMMMA